MERVANKSMDFKSAEEWDIRQHTGMSPRERTGAARKLKDRFYPAGAKDVRACHRKK